MNLIIALLPTVLLTLYGQLMTKWRVGVVADRIEEVGTIDRIIAFVTDPVIISAYAMTFAASIAWMFVVQKFPLSQAYPIYIGLSISIVTISSIVLFREAITPQKAISITLIITGIAVGAQS